MVAPVSNISAVLSSQGAQSNAPAGKKSSSSSEQATDTVTLSPAAQAHMQSGDVDHDGDSH
jgi:hypothetical protein